MKHWEGRNKVILRDWGTYNERKPLSHSPVWHLLQQQGWGWGWRGREKEVEGEREVLPYKETGSLKM